MSFSIFSDGVFNEKEVQDAVMESILQLYGLKGLSLIAPTLIEFDEKDQRGIIRCNHSYLRLMRASLAYVTSIRGSGASIIVKKVSGTIKSLKS
ncbi:ribonuclease P protein component 2 [Candidatus Bathyarchaeota archaeon]|nr:ribonuclease P protein component 2 [Candidatus Bathyarchaeota archaeon]